MKLLCAPKSIAVSVATIVNAPTYRTNCIIIYLIYRQSTRRLVFSALNDCSFFMVKICHIKPFFSFYYKYVILEKRYREGILNTRQRSNMLPQFRYAKVQGTLALFFLWRSAFVLSALKRLSAFLFGLKCSVSRPFAALEA